MALNLLYIEESTKIYTILRHQTIYYDKDSKIKFCQHQRVVAKGIQEDTINTRKTGELRHFGRHFQDFYHIKKMARWMMKRSQNHNLISSDRARTLLSISTWAKYIMLYTPYYCILFLIA